MQVESKLLDSRMQGNNKQFEWRIQDLLDLVARFRYKDRMRQRRTARALPKPAINTEEESSDMHSSSSTMYNESAGTSKQDLDLKEDEREENEAGKKLYEEDHHMSVRAVEIHDVGDDRKKLFG